MSDLKMLKKNDLVEVAIIDMGSDGEGIGRYQGFTLFIKGGVVGDKAEVLVLKVKKSYGYAKIVRILEASPYRVEPKCPLSGRCGGCQLLPLSYEKQLEYKQNKVKNCLERIGGISNADDLMEPIIGMEEPYFYRNKAQFPVGRNKDGEVVIGFYAGYSHTVIDTEQCYIQAQINESIMKRVREFLTEEKVSIYDEEKHTGLVRHILTRVGFTTGEVMVCVVINGEELPKVDHLVSRLLEIHNEQDFYKVVSVCLNVNANQTNVILGERVISVYGNTFITDCIGDVKYRISPLSFYQVNPVQTKKLYDKALEYAALTGNEVVWDLYCGIGTISLFLAKKAKQVYGVEIVRDAVLDAKKNAEINGIVNAEFFVGAAEEVLPSQYRENGDSMRADVVVVDPPRKGCEESLLDTIVQMQPERIVYVSCDPGTLARDIRYLGERGYEVKKVAAVDQFGMTVHTETICLLERAENLEK